MSLSIESAMNGCVMAAAKSCKILENVGYVESESTSDILNVL